MSKPGSRQNCCEFDKWRKNYFPKAIKDDPFNWVAWSIITKDCWCAALEWVLIKCKKEDLWYRDVINQELKAIKNG